jgi:hypothetical protein
MIAIFRDATAAEIAAGIKRVNNQVRIPFTYRGLQINNDTYEIDQVAISTAYDAVTEPRAQADGLEAYDPKKIQTMIQSKGVIRATSLAALHDAIDDLNVAFDPALSKYPNPSSDPESDGFVEFYFDYPTADTAHYATGLIPMFYRVRPLELPVQISSRFSGLSTMFSLSLLAADPRRYWQTVSSASRTNGGSLTADNTLATYFSFPAIQITLAAAGPASLFLTRPSNNYFRDSETLTLNLSSCSSGDVIDVDMENRAIFKNGVAVPSLYSSGNFWALAPATSHGLSVGTFTGTVEVAWRRAFV